MQLGRIAQLGILNVAVVVLPMLGGGAVHARAAAQPARELQVLVGAGQDTVGIDAYLPRELLKHRNTRVSVHIGTVVPAERLAKFSTHGVETRVGSYRAVDDRIGTLRARRCRHGGEKAEGKAGKFFHM